MTKEKVDVTLEALKEMGMGGAHFHCRTGMDMQYLGTEFMEIMRYAIEKAKKLEMKTYLYDEDRWPSGYGGGFVTKDKEFRSRFLLFSPKELPLEEEAKAFDGREASSGKAISSGERTFLARYEICLNEGCLQTYRRLEENERSEASSVWYAYLEISGDNPWFNNQAYVNTLDPRAIRRFLEVAYERYYEAFGTMFGTEIPSIFTDEPQFSFKSMLGYAADLQELTLPYTDDFDETYFAAFGESILNYLPELFWELPNNAVSVHRYHYHSHLSERFAKAYSDQIGEWCEEHGILLTGHMMREPFLESQTAALGEAMRNYRKFGMPGIDNLCDKREFTTAKQAQSAVHQYGRSGMTSELYGVTNWDFDFRNHKLSGDWQAALGVTLRVPHLTWTSMRGEAKRDYPASIGPQSPWYQEYPYIENYFARVNTVLTAGKPEVRIGVIHPVESYWLYWGCREQTEEIRNEQEQRFLELIDWLLYGLIDFDYISEALLTDFRQEKESGFQVGAMSYEAIIVPSCVTLRSTTIERLAEFRKRGGTVIFAGKIPEYADAVRSDSASKLADSCVWIPWSRAELLKTLEPERFLEIRTPKGSRTDWLIHQLRMEGKEKWLFVARGNKVANPDLAVQEELRFSVKGHWQVEAWNPLCGSVIEKEVYMQQGSTGWEEVSCEYDSFLYRLIPAEECCENYKNLPLPVVSSDRNETLSACCKKQLSEPNVYILDQAEHKLDDGPWMEKEEVLRIDNHYRKQLGYHPRTEALAQPWVMADEATDTHWLYLCFLIDSDISCSGISLALETPGEVELMWNEVPVKKEITGWYADRDIKTIQLPDLKAGKNRLAVKLPFSPGFQVEAMYLLGDFGVSCMGREAKIVKPEFKLYFGDTCFQGLPFYGGNLHYETEFEIRGAHGKRVDIRISKFRCPIIKVRLDGQDMGLIVIAPYTLNLGVCTSGRHKLELIAYGNRVNTFGALHNCNQTELWIGPNAWRTEGTAWSYEYQLRPTGILVSPVLRIYD